MKQKCENFPKISSLNAKVSRRCKMRKYFCQVRNSKMFLWNVKISRNVWFHLVVLKSIFIFCVNPSIGLADKSLFENESCILKILSFLMNFRNFIAKFSHYFFAKFSHFFEKQIAEAKFSYFSRVNETRTWSKTFDKRFFIFAENPNLYIGQIFLILMK